MMYGSYGMGPWGALFMVALMIVGGLLLWGLIATGVLMLAHYLRGPDQSGGSADAGSSARLVLSQRYARGEIDENEYTQRLSVLNATAQQRRGG